MFHRSILRAFTTVGTRKRKSLEAARRTHLRVEALESRVLPVTGLYFDFGTASSPVSAGYTQVTETTLYGPTWGYGWQRGNVASRDRGTSGDLNRDFNFTPDGAFAVDVPNGTYSVSVTLGDAWVAHDQMGVYLEGALVDIVTLAANQFATRTYSVSVRDGQLSLGPEADDL